MIPYHGKKCVTNQTLLNMTASRLKTKGIPLTYYF